MYGCGLRIGEALAVRTRCRINRGTTLRVREQVNPAAQLQPLKSRAEGQFRDIPLPLYVSEAIDKHIADHGTTEDGYLFQGRRHKHVTRRTYQEDFERAAAKAGLPPEFIPHTLRHCYASTALARGIPITEVSRWLGHKSIEVTHQIYGHLVPASWDRARTVLDDARRAGRHQPPPRKTRAEPGARRGADAPALARPALATRRPGTRTRSLSCALTDALRLRPNSVGLRFPSLLQGCRVPVAMHGSCRPLTTVLIMPDVRIPGVEVQERIPRRRRMRDLDRIERALATNRLSAQVFERCGQDLLSTVYQGLTPVPGGSDWGRTPT